jgi:hypothetical protein
MYIKWTKITNSNAARTKAICEGATGDKDAFARMKGELRIAQLIAKIHALHDYGMVAEEFKKKVVYLSIPGKENKRGAPTNSH